MAFKVLDILRSVVVFGTFVHHISGFPDCRGGSCGSNKETCVKWCCLGVFIGGMFDPFVYADILPSTAWLIDAPSQTILHLPDTLNFTNSFHTLCLTPHSAHVLSPRHPYAN